MFKKILFTTDFSDASMNILECLKNLKEIGVEEVTIVHILDAATVGGLLNLISKFLKPKVDQFENILKEAGFKADTKIEIGNVGREVNRICIEGNYSLIVAGTHGESVLKGILLGSKIKDILSSSRKPVLLIPLNVIAKKDEEKIKPICFEMFKNILYPTDFSDNAEIAFFYLEEIAKMTMAKVTLCHIQDIKRIEPHLKHKLEEFNKIDMERLTRIERQLKDIQVEVAEKIIDYGNPSEKITELGNSKKYNLIIMGTQGRGFMDEPFLGRVANYAAHHIDIPILFIPPFSKI